MSVDIRLTEQVYSGAAELTIKDEDVMPLAQYIEPMLLPRDGGITLEKICQQIRSGTCRWMGVPLRVLPAVR